MHRAMFAAPLVVVLAFALTTRRAFTQESPGQYRVSIGQASAKLDSGTLWLYSYSWYGLQKVKVASIEHGVAMVTRDTERLKRELDPHPNTEAYVFVVQVNDHLWFRTPDISPDGFWSDFPRALDALGRTATLPGGETQLILPALAKRRITLLHQSGRPFTNATVPVSIYLYDRNHCAAHAGLPLGSFRTDKRGTIEVLAPLVPLYLDLNHYENAGTGPAGMEYEINVGLKIGAEQSVMLQKGVGFPGAERLSGTKFRTAGLDIQRFA